MKNWFKSLTDEGQLMLVSVLVTVYSWIFIVIAVISCYCFGAHGLVDPLMTLFKSETYAVGGVLAVFLTHSGAGRIWGKTDNMKDIVAQSDEDEDGDPNKDKKDGRTS